MKINVTGTIKNLDGSELEGAALTIREALITPLISQLRDDNPSGPEKFTRFQLAQRIQRDDEVELTAEEAAKLKHLVGLGYGVLVVGQIYPLLDG